MPQRAYYFLSHHLHFKPIPAANNGLYVSFSNLPSDLAHHVRYRCPAVDAGFPPDHFVLLTFITVSDIFITVTVIKED